MRRETDISYFGVLRRFAVQSKPPASQKMLAVEPRSVSHGNKRGIAFAAAKATAVATVHRTVAKSRLSIPLKTKNRQVKTCLFFVGGDKRDRTADLMTGSCDRFVISGDFEYNTSV